MNYIHKHSSQDSLFDMEQEQPQQEAAPKKYSAWMGAHLKAISQISQHVDEILKAALEDVRNHDGAGHHFRAAVLQLGVSGVGPKVCSFAWLLLQPMTSQLATIDTHMMDVLGHNYEQSMNNRDYPMFERQLRAGLDAAGYGHLPLGVGQWTHWDSKRNGQGSHQDHSAMRVENPTPVDQVDWNAKEQNLKGDDWHKQAPDWWQNTKPARDAVAQDWQQNVAPNWPQNQFPYNVSNLSKTGSTPQIKIWEGDDGDHGTGDRPWAYDRVNHQIHVGPVDGYHIDLAKELEPHGIDIFGSSMPCGRTGDWSLRHPEYNMIQKAIDDAGLRSKPWNFSKVAGESKDEFHVRFVLPQQTVIDLSALSHQLDWPEGSEIEDADDYHMTAFFSPEGFSDQKMHDWIAAHKESGFRFENPRLESFPSSGSGLNPIVVRFDCESAERLVERLKDEADALGIEHRRFPGKFKPHITLGYAPEPLEGKVALAPFRSGDLSVSLPRALQGDEPF